MHTEESVANLHPFSTNSYTFILIRKLSFRKAMSKSDMDNDILSVRKTPGSGRGVFASEPISQYALVRTFTPRVRVVKAEAPGSQNDMCSSYCQYCSERLEHGIRPEYLHDGLKSQRKLGGPVECKGCQLYTYCSSQCYKQDWSSHHKYECDIFQRLVSKFGSEYVLDLHTRLLMRAYICCCLDTTFKEQVLGLVSNVEKFISKDTDIFTWVEQKSIEISKAILEVQLNTKTAPDVRKLIIDEQHTDAHRTNYIQRLFCICLTNSNDYLSYENEHLGASLDLEFSLINHSCVPNTTFHQISKESFALYSNVDLKKNREVTTNYSFTNYPKFMRQRYLQHQFNFECNCKLCKQEIDLYFSYNCSKCNQILCEPDLQSFFSLYTEISFKFKKGANNVCPTCANRVSFDSLYAAKRTHRRAIAFLISEISTSLEKKKNYEELNLDTFVQDLELPREQLIDVIYPVYFNAIKVNVYSYKLMHMLLQEVEAIGNIPLYCFPYGNFVTAMKVYHDSILPEKPLTELPEYVIELVNLATKMCFEVDIPSVLGEAKLPLIHELINLVTTLLEAVEIILNSKKLNEAYFHNTPWKVYTDASIFEILSKTAIFIIHQAMEICSFYFELDSELYRTLVGKVNYTIHLARKAENVELIPKINNNHLEVQDNELIPLVKVFLLELTNVTNVRFKKSKLCVQLSDRNYTSLLINCKVNH